MTLVKYRAGAVLEQSTGIAAVFLSNWAFGAQLVELATQCMYKKHRLTFRLSYLKVMPRYYVAACRQYRQQYACQGQ